MATRQADSMNLVKRCKDAGWTVERNGDGWIVHTPTGPYGIHLTYSDRRSVMLAEYDLKRRGLLEAEETKAAMTERERVSKMLKDQADNDKKLAAAEARAKAAQADAQNKMLTVARGDNGGYLYTQDVGFDWFTADHPAMGVKQVRIDKKLAEQLMTLNVNNRPLRYTRTDRVGGIILSDQWRTTHQGLAIDRNKNLQDGQHRIAGFLKACEVNPDLTIDVVFFVGVDPDNFKAIDEGSARTAADLLRRGQLPGSGTYASAVAAIVRLSIAIGNGGENPRKRPTNTDVVDWANANNPDDIRAAAAWAVGNYKHMAGSPAGLGAAHYALSKTLGADNPYLALFLHGLSTGAKYGTNEFLDDLDPRRVVVRQLNNDKFRGKKKTPIDQYRLIITAWNYLVSGRTVHTISIRDDTPIPTPLLSKPGDGGSPPAMLGREYGIRLTQAEGTTA